MLLPFTKAGTEILLFHPTKDNVFHIGKQRDGGHDVWLEFSPKSNGGLEAHFYDHTMSRVAEEKLDIEFDTLFTHLGKTGP